jgi:type IV pilus assembly protein PilM
MFSLQHRHHFPIGIDIAHDVVRMVQLTRGPSGELTVLAALRRPLTVPDGATALVRARAAVDAIAGVLAMEGFVGRRAVVCLPGGMVHTRTLRLPTVSAGSIESHPQLRSAFDFDLSAATLRLLQAGSVRHTLPQGEEIIAVAARNAELDEFTELLHERRIRAASMEPRMFALYRAAVRSCDENSALALLDLGADCARMLIARDGQIRFLKNIPASPIELARSLARALGIGLEEAKELRRRTLATPAIEATGHDPVRRAVVDAGRAQVETLASEVARCLRYHAVTFPGPQPATLVVSGPEANDAQLHELLVAQTGLAVQTMDPFMDMNMSAMRAADRNANRFEWGVAVGVALKKVSAGTGMPPHPEVVEEADDAQPIEVALA